MTLKRHGIHFLTLFLILLLGLLPTLSTAQERGNASYYADKYHLKGKTASGELYDKYKFTAAHRTLPFGTIVEVENLANDRSVKVRINDRGPFVPGRIIDLSYAAAEQIGLIRAGIAQVEIRIIREAISNGDAPSLATPPPPNVDYSDLPVVDALGRDPQPA
ncbi:MAG: septal ring lytic transglycosylase RlpA family protein, partial [Bacteroidota bacterium]